MKEKLDKLTDALEEAEKSEAESETETEKVTEKNDETEETKEAASTGDNTPADMWMIAMLGSLLVLLLLGKKRYSSVNW